MAIVFRCPECGHKVRASDELIGKQARCKCGVAIDVPRAVPAEQATDILDPSASTWALQAGPSADGCEPISTWSPLFGPGNEKEISRSADQAQRRLRAVLVGVAGLLGLILVVGITAFAVDFVRRHSNAAPPADVPVAAAVPPGEDQPTPEARPNVAAGSQQAAAPPLKTNPTRKPDPATKPITPRVTSPKQEKPPAYERGLALANPPAEDTRFESKHAPAKDVLNVKDRAAIEIVGWHTAASFTVEDTPGKTRLLSLNPAAAAKLGVVLVAVQVRMPAEPLLGKEFAVLSPDAKLIAAKGGPYHAIGIRIGEETWFAPPEGQRLYPIDSGIPKAAPVQQGWLFIAPAADLNAGRLSFQFRDQAPVPLKAKAGRTGP